MPEQVVSSFFPRGKWPLADLLQIVTRLSMMPSGAAIRNTLIEWRVSQWCVGQGITFTYCTLRCGTWRTGTNDVISCT